MYDLIGCWVADPQKSQKESKSQRVKNKQHQTYMWYTEIHARKTLVLIIFLKSKQKRKRGKRKKNAFFQPLFSQICDNFPKVTLGIHRESVNHSLGFKTLVITLFDERFLFIVINLIKEIYNNNNYYYCYIKWSSFFSRHRTKVLAPLASGYSNDTIHN